MHDAGTYIYGGYPGPTGCHARVQASIHACVLATQVYLEVQIYPRDARSEVPWEVICAHEMPNQMYVDVNHD